MATVKELIKDILAIDDSYSEKELKKLLKVDLEEILGDLTFYLESENEEDGDKIVEDEEYEEIIIDISKLSKFEKRHYAKTGQLPQSTINRYTRFDDEEVESDF
jgi:hypothetical protein